MQIRKRGVILTKVYACYSKNEEERLLSSSGGIYPLLAEYILQQGGAVFAACYDDSLEVCHMQIRTLDELKKSQGAKYMASKLGDTFGSVRNILLAEQPVLFAGTPCQCAGLESYLQAQRIDTKALFCVDFICHGVPGRASWRAYKEGQEQRNGMISQIQMRDKSSGWTRYGYSWKYTFGDGRICYQKQSENTYMKGFVSNLFLRPSCYRCGFRRLERPTDLTLGDYWGIWDIQPEMDDDRGTSLVLVHSEKGRELFRGIENQMIYKETSIKAAIRENPSILVSPGLTGKRADFFHLLSEGEEFDDIIDKLAEKSFADKVKHKIWKVSGLSFWRQIK